MMFRTTKQMAGAGLLALAAGLACHAAYAQDDQQGDPSPFPPGKNAMLVKQTCLLCHTPNVVMSQTFNEKTARKIYQEMLGESADMEQGKKIVEYPTTYMGEKDGEGK